MLGLLFQVLSVRQKHSSAILIDALPRVKLILAGLHLNGVKATGTLVLRKQMLQLFSWDMHSIDLRNMHMSLLFIMEHSLLLRRDHDLVPLILLLIC